MTMKFEVFSSLCEAIEKTTSSIEKVEMLSSFLKQIPKEEIQTTIRILSGNPVYPPELKSGIGNSTVKQAICSITSLPIETVNTSLKETGDLGTSAMCLLKQKNTKKQSTLAFFSDDQSSLSILEVHKKFIEIACLNGNLSSSKKTTYFESLLSEVSPEEAKFICRLALEDLRIGVAENTIVNAIANATGLSPILVDRAFCITNDIGFVADLAISHGHSALELLTPQTGKYIRPMLGQISKDSLDEIIESIDDVTCEWKYDGARLQIHKKGKDVQVFSKKPENITTSLPDVVELIRSQVTSDETILEGEVVAIDENCDPLPFKILMQRIRRINNISAYVESTPICLYLFDILLDKGISLIDQPLYIRRQQLEKIVKSSDRIRLSEHLATKNVTNIEQMYNDALQAGHEGIMIKNSMSSYTPGKRGKDWIKKKPLMENLDLVITGGEWGHGRRTGMIGSYTLSCLDETSDTYLSIGKIGTALSDELLASMTDALKPFIESEDGTEIVITPNIVLEVSYEEIQESQKYASGFSLRFPRLVRVRDEKGVHDIATSKQIQILFQQQSNSEILNKN